VAHVIVAAFFYKRRAIPAFNPTVGHIRRVELGSVPTSPNSNSGNNPQSARLDNLRRRYQLLAHVLYGPEDRVLLGFRGQDATYPTKLLSNEPPP
jgi:hypothetical protein